MVVTILKKKQRSSEDLKLSHVLRTETDSQYSDCTRNLHCTNCM